ncbi:nicotinamide/nicotinic acid mononucleotide adenylyltransferase isoform X5 [Elaeis guineensis]|uniref:Nicotinamide/nicotinic acid mononucleotide adenylyltransferase isoform X2 n=1 Tax=Elaeis guineensis var. tenera TaxID=51953 RepID=A0A6I9S129_ELAGV|nr:nicotinamide/nicotinic acid mononucleotide adenylyltransferase isoform X2 [Elaeis guineensis]
MDSFVDVPLPMDKLSLGALGEAGASETGKRNQIFVVLVATGSFNPPTYMHLRMFELAKDALKAQGCSVIGGYMSPANDAYRKKDLLSANHRIQLCELACKSSSFVMVDPWEAKQNSYQRTLTVLSRIKSSLCKTGLVSEESLKIMLLCGSDLLESFSIPGFWKLDQSNIISVDEIVPNQISATRVRECIRRGLSIKYLTPDEVIEYIEDQKLYLKSNDD